MKKYFFKLLKLTDILRKFILRDYKWVIAIITTIPTSIVAYQSIRFEKQSDSFYYVPSYFNGNDVNNLNEADCWTGSISTNRSDAFRCSSKNGISDPCYQNPIHNSMVICPDSPNDKKPSIYKAKIDLAHKNDPEKNPEFSSPWYIIMHDGSKCRILTGTSIAVAGKRFDYSCIDGKKISDLSLPVKKKDGKLYISCVVDNRIIEDCIIKEAWY